MQLILEEDQSVSVKVMSVVEPPITENIPIVSPSLHNTPSPIRIKESADLEKFEDNTEDSEKRNGISETHSEEGSIMLEENENGHDTFETDVTKEMSEKEDVENNYDDKEKSGEQSEACVAVTVNGGGRTVDEQEQCIETENDNVSIEQREEKVNTETINFETVSPKKITEPTNKDMETDIDFSDDNAADESFEIKLDSSFEDLDDDLDDDTSKKTEITDNIEKMAVEVDKTENANDKTENLAEMKTDVSENLEDIVEKTEDSVEKIGDRVEETEAIIEKPEDAVGKVKYITEQIKDTAEKTENIAEKTEDTIEKTEDIQIANSIDETIVKRNIVTVNKSDVDDEIENANLTENVTTDHEDAQKNTLSQTPPSCLILGSTEQSKLEGTELKSFKSETVHESATESMGTENTADRKELSSNVSVSRALQKKNIESTNTGKDVGIEKLVDSSDNDTIKKSKMEINEADKESLHEVQAMEECKAFVENSLAVSAGASKPEANSADKMSMEIDTASPAYSAPTKETKAGDEKQKDAETSLKAAKESSSSSDVEIMDVDNDDSAPKNKDEAKKRTAETDTPVKNKKRDSRINLDIFSDEEDDEPESKNEEPTTETQAKATLPNLDTQTKPDPSKDCVSLDDDDDDIMVIDDEAASKNIKETEHGQGQEKTEESEKAPEVADKPGSDYDDVFVSAESVDKEKTETEPEPTESESESKRNTARPLAASDFINNFKTKISEMTRADLEEFCLLKIVEGVVDRSNLSEIKHKLKQMMLNVEEWRKKTLILNKQNRDLQIVLRTVQEEQKRRSDEMITPLKITRSVGMQVLIGDGKADPLNRIRTNQKRPAATQPQKPANPPPAKPEPKPKPPQIPVPRLVPAPSPTKPGPSKPSPLQNATVTSNTKNGIKPATKGAEKRPLGDTVDLTDDEPAPPSKRPPPVRLVPSNQLLAPRAPMVGKTNSPRQVYIPIGQQANIRPGQKIAFKSPVAGPSPRGRVPDMAILRNATPRSVVPRGPNKHPAPLPQAYQQPQPPNWKALPPAPDLKISKIENGIVVSWKIDGYQEDSYEEIVSYQLYAYQETSQPASTYLWNKIGDIKALPLPMACTLTQFIAGYKYYFAVRAVDVRSRLGPFSLPGSILLLNK